MASASSPCIPHWYVASSAAIHNEVDGGSIGTVSLLRDGCGKIQAKLHPLIITASMYVYLINTKNATIGIEATGTGSTDITTAIYSHDEGLTVSATGTITQIAGNSPSISVGQTANNSGN
jgi:hypothetical protein